MKHNILSVCVLVFFIIGCKTGGLRIGEDSAGKIVKPKTIKEINKGSSIPKGNPAPEKPIVESTENIPDGNLIPKREEVTSWEEAAPLPPIEKVKIPPVKSTPISPRLSIAEPETDNFDIALASANLELSKLDYDKPILPDLPLGDVKDNMPILEVVPAPDLEKTPEEKSDKEKVEKRELEAKRLSELEKENMKINWSELILFYFLALMILIIAYITYDFIREMKKQDKEGNPFAKKPTKKRSPKKTSKKTAPKKAAKKAPAKKKVAKKKVAKKKVAKKKAALRKK